MQTALLDTNVVAAWHGGDKPIKDAAVKHLSALGKDPGLFISAVTVQRGADRQQIGLWQRDAAIAGTAAVRKLNAVWTRDTGFRQFQEHVDFDIVVLPGATKSTA